MFNVYQKKGMLSNYLGKVDLKRPERKSILDMFDSLARELEQEKYALRACQTENERLNKRIEELEEVIKSGGKFEQFQSLMQSVYYDKIQKIKQIIEDDSEYPDYWDDYD